MTSQRRRLISVLFVIIGIISAAFVFVETNTDVIIPGRVVGYDIEVQGNFAYVSNNDGVSVIDMSVLSAPVRVASIQVPDGVFGLDIVGRPLTVSSNWKIRSAEASEDWTMEYFWERSLSGWKNRRIYEMKATSTPRVISSLII